ncbi:MAG: endonuclease VIII [Myxococcota bacterium]
MPEGPEVRRAADQIQRAIGGDVATEVFFAFERLEEWAERFTGDRVDAVETYGKALCVVFGCGYAVYTHNQLYGKWLVRRAGTAPRTGRQLRFMVETAEKSALLYSASEIEVRHRDELEEHPYIAKLGPDPLRPETDRDAILAQFERHPRRSLGAALLDQSFIAGIGNYLRSEILFEAGLVPEWRACDLDDDEASRLADAVMMIVERAYKKRGVTVEPELAKRCKADGWRRREYRHYVFGRAGRECFRCGEVIERDEIGGRRLYWCPGCQE